MRSLQILETRFPAMPRSVLLKALLLSDGLRYTEALGEAVATAYPNWAPYRFAAGEPNPTGKPTALIPFLMRFPDRTMLRIKPNPASVYAVERSGDAYALLDTGADEVLLDGVGFEPRGKWIDPQATVLRGLGEMGVSRHGDMMVLNLAPGCEYFADFRPGGPGESERCTFCLYGAPDARLGPLQQKPGDAPIPDAVMERALGLIAIGLEGVRHVYLTGGGMLDLRAEGARYLQIVRALRASGLAVPQITCGSQALHEDDQRAIRDAGADAACFNMEVWDPEQFRRICPGKEKHVGRETWIARLLSAAEIFGHRNVMSAFVGGVELTPPDGFATVDEALKSCLEGSEFLLSHGIFPIYSLFWPPGRAGGQGGPDDPALDYFLRLAQGQWELRQKYGFAVPTHLVCQSCDYMQIDADLQALGAPAVA